MSAGAARTALSFSGGLTFSLSSLNAAQLNLGQPQASPVSKGAWMEVCYTPVPHLQLLPRHHNQPSDSS